MSSPTPKLKVIPPGLSGSNDNLPGLSPHLEKLSLGPRTSIMPEVPLSPGTFQDKRKRLRRQINCMVQNLEKECYRIIFDVFPEKIKLLDEMYKNRKEFNLKKSQVTQELPTLADLTGANKDEQEKKSVTVLVPANKCLTDLVEILQKEILEMSEMINALSIWVKLNVPRMADGNNFGVEVQEEISKVLEGAEDAGYDVLDSFASYHSTRGGIVTQVLKHPNVEDFRFALRELDEKTYIKTCLLASELRNDYITIYDLLAKNLDTLITPRGGEDEKLARMY
jgi:proteasome activator subunit 2 (PA28 beta)